MDKHTRPAVAVVILNWNGADMLRNFLPSVVNHSRGEARVIVADNGSTDHSARVVEQEFPEVEWLPLHHNYGFAEGYNRALAMLEADYFVLLNSDVEVTPHWLTPLLAHMAAHPGVAACQPKLLSWRKRDTFEYAGAAGGYIDYMGYPFCRGRVFDTLEADRGQYDDVAHIFWATGAALMIRREDWQAVGGLDGDFFAHMEEIDLCWRLRARGRLIDCVPASVAYHVGGATLGPENPRKTYLNFRNNLLMLYKNLPDRQLGSVMRRRACLDAIVALKCLLTGQWGNAAAIVRARRDYRRMRPSFAEKRRANLAAATADRYNECLYRSLVAAYYIGRKHTFPQLAAQLGR